jgi:hypothetical protein
VVVTYSFDLGGETGIFEKREMSKGKYVYREGERFDSRHTLVPI